MDPFLEQRFETIGDHVILSLSGVAVIKLSNLTGDFSLNTKLCVENGPFFRPKDGNNRRLQIPRGKYSVYPVLHKVWNLTGVH